MMHVGWVASSDISEHLQPSRAAKKLWLWKVAEYRKNYHCVHQKDAQKLYRPNRCFMPL